MGDLTVVYYTANHVPVTWETFILSELLVSIDDLPLITVSQKPMRYGNNLCVGDIGRSHLNIYRQMLIGAEEARTEYVAFVEDDILYPPCHFKFRPSGHDVAAYDMFKWALYTWMKPPCFNLSAHRLTTGLIVDRAMFIDAMRERFDKYPDDDKAPLRYWAEIGRREQELGVTVRKSEEFYPDTPHLVVFHERALGFENLGRRKRANPIQQESIPYWGSAADILIKYYAD